MSVLAPARVLLRSSLCFSNGRAVRLGSSPSRLTVDVHGGTEASVRCFSQAPKWASKTPHRFGFCFDIDGVLLHKSTPIPGAIDTLKLLQQREIPFVFLTNGGGKSEPERAAELSRLLGIDVHPAALVLSHTPFTILLDDEKPALPYFLANDKFDTFQLRGKTVLVTGSNASKAREIATAYGFKSVVTPGDILKACPEIFPFDPLSDFYAKQETRPLPKPIYSPKRGPQNLQDCLKIDAFLVFNDPRDWAVDIQLMRDLAISHNGYLGTRAVDFGRNSASFPVIFSNDDFLWSAGFHLPRLGQGAFRRAVEGLFSGAESPNINVRRFGKPFPVAYWNAKEALRLQVQKLSGLDTKLNRIYMVGDNPDSDIEGANSMRAIDMERNAESMKGWSETRNKEAMRLSNLGSPWRSVLVRTGVWRDGDDFTTKLKEPDAICDDVAGAVQWATAQEATYHSTE